MSYADGNAAPIVMHAIGENQNTACGQWSAHAFTWSSSRARVTCKRCLTSLAKQDRTFQRSARRQFKAFARSERDRNFLDSVSKYCPNSFAMRAAGALSAEAGLL